MLVRVANQNASSDSFQRVNRVAHHIVWSPRSKFILYICDRRKIFQQNVYFQSIAWLTMIDPSMWNSPLSGFTLDPWTMKYKRHMWTIRLWAKAIEWALVVGCCVVVSRCQSLEKEPEISTCNLVVVRAWSSMSQKDKEDSKAMDILWWLIQGRGYYRRHHQEHNRLNT